jgi:predicted nucleic acid-binding protein
VIATLVVSDTSPLRALAHLSLLPVLGQLFHEVVVPPAVAAEVTVGRPKLPPLDLSPFAFIRKQAVRDPGSRRAVCQRPTSW